MTPMSPGAPGTLEQRIKTLEDRIAVLEAAADVRPTPKPRAKILPGDWEELCQRLLAKPGALSAWERGFVEDASSRDAPSEKQLALAQKIEARVLAGKPAPKPRRAFASDVPDGMPF